VRHAVAQPPLPVPDDIAKLDRAALEDRLRAAEAKIDALLPLHEKFEIASRGPESEPRVRTVIDRVFGVEGSDESPYDLECRGDLCRFQTDRPSREWEEPLQSELGPVVRDLMMTSDAVYFELDDPARAVGKQYVIGIADALWRSPAFVACKRGVTTPGIVNVTLQIVARHIEVAVSGALADAPVGACVRHVIEDLVRAAPLPDDVTQLPINTLPVRVP
jgi:hypothetical protein